jgi:hypothetical protein
MFVGHGLVAFAIAASVASHYGWSSERALAVGLVAGLFGTVPDIDMLYAVVGLVGGLEGVFVTSDTFWSVANEVHRGATHSLVVGTVAALGFAGWRARADLRSGSAGVAILWGLVATIVAIDGPVTGGIVTVFLVAGLGVVALAERLGFGALTVLATAAVGLLAHPFGDVLAGPSPGLLYPLDVTLLGKQVILHADPTLHLLGTFFVELTTIWLALAVFANLRGWQLRDRVSPRAALGVVYGGAVFVIPAPTVGVASPFVFSVLAVGLVGVPLHYSVTPDRRSRTVVTALAAVTVAALAYGVAYLALLA